MNFLKKRFFFYLNAVKQTIHEVEFFGYPLTILNAVAGNLLGWKIYGNSKQDIAPLPSGYQQVEYIQSTGTQYIDSGVVSNDCVIEQDVAFNGGERTLMGFGGNSGQFWGSTAEDKYEIGTRVIQTLDTKERRTMVATTTADTLTLTVEGQTISREKTVLSTLSYKTILSSFGGNGLKIYGIKITDAGVLVRNLVPARRALDSVLGMYDLVSNCFFTKSGTGYFTAGEDVPSASFPVEVDSVGDKTDDGYEIPINVNSTLQQTAYLDKPLCKIGTNADYIDYENQQVVRNVGVKVFDGTENWGWNSYGWFYALTTCNVGTPIDIELCTHFRYGISGANMFRLHTNKYAYIYDQNGAEWGGDIAVFKAWLAQQYASGTPVTIYYPLASTTTESLAVPALAMSNGTNVITTDTELEPSDAYAKANCV